MKSIETALRVKKFFETPGMLTHTKGDYAGKPFILEKWQWEKIILPLYGTVDRNRKRQYREGYLSVARKNGKSELMAGLGLYHLVGDGEMGGEIYSVATDRDQASLVFDMAATMVRHSGILRRIIKIIDSRKRMYHSKSGSIYEAIASDVEGSHGYNPSFVIFDELHAQSNRELYDVMSTGSGTRRHPLILSITTAGFDQESICYEIYNRAKQIKKGVIKDKAFFSYIAELGANDDWTLEENWYKANPALGTFRNLDEMESAYEKAKTTPAYQNTFRRLYLNQWTQSVSRWIDLAAWDACVDEYVMDDLYGEDCFAGLDLSTTTDITALSLVFPPSKTRPYYDIFLRCYMPADNIIEKSRKDWVNYGKWVDQGWIKATPGNVVDYDFILKDLKEYRQKFNLREVAFDRWGAGQVSQALDKSGFKVVPFGQGFVSMSAPSKDFLAFILQKKIRHNHNPVLRWMIDNCVVREDAAGNIKPAKDKSRHRIDGVVATIMGLDRAVRHSKSIYEERGVIML